MRIVPDEHPRRQQRTPDDAPRHRQRRRLVQRHRILPLGGIALQQPRRKRRAVVQQKIQRLPRPQILRQQRQKVGRPETGALVRLRHQIANMDFDRRRLIYRLRHILHQQVRQNAGINVPRPQHDGVCLGDGVQRRRVGVGFRIQINIVNGNIQIVPPQVNRRFPGQFRPVLQPGAQGGAGQGNRQHCPVDAQQPRRLVNGGYGIAGYLGQRRQQQVAETMPVQPLPGGKAIVKKPPHQVGRRIVPGQRHQTPPQIPRRQMPQLRPQPPAAAAAVGHRDNGGKIAAPGPQPGQGSMIAGAAADHNNILLFPHRGARQR